MDRDEIRHLHPYIQTSDLEGGVWFPEDSVADNLAVSETLATLSRQNGN